MRFLLKALDIVVFSTYDYLRQYYKRKRARSEKRMAAIQVKSADLRASFYSRSQSSMLSLANVGLLKNRTDHRPDQQIENNYSDQLLPPYSFSFKEI